MKDISSVAPKWDFSAVKENLMFHHSPIEPYSNSCEKYSEKVKGKTQKTFYRNLVELTSIHPQAGL
jgi:hypothetical protein